MTFSASSLLTHLTSLLPPNCTGVAVAFSGGLDSTVLLHALRGARPNWPIRAIHIDHNLHPDAQKWARHCEEYAAALGVAFEAHSLGCERISEEGIEAAARRARYAALASCLQPNECLLTAHHADDQAETVLLALIRGTGVRGLAAMPLIKPFASGWHARPLLPYTRQALGDYAREHALRYLNDPANANERFARNHLRNVVIPALRTRWPDVAQRVARTSVRMAEASELLDEVAEADATPWIKDKALAMAALNSMHRARRNNVLRWWLRKRGARAPSAHRLDALWQDVSTSAADRVPHIDVDELRVFRHKGFLYAESIQQFDVAAVTAEWTLEGSIQTAVGSLRAYNTFGAGIAERELKGPTTVRYRRGGEELQIHSNGLRRSLKKLLQEAHVLPWWRDRIPLIYAGDRLLGVADLWIEASARADVNEPGRVIEWIDRPQQLHTVQ